MLLWVKIAYMSTILSREGKTTTDDCEADYTPLEKRQQFLGIVGTNEEIRNAFTENDDESVSPKQTDSTYKYILVSGETFSTLCDVRWFTPDSMTAQDIVDFTENYTDEVHIEIRIKDTDETFEVEINRLAVTGTVTNEIIADFATAFKCTVSKTFDPLAENHEMPILQVLA